MPLDPQRTFDSLWAFSLAKKQTDYATILADADLTAKVPITDSSFGQINQTKLTDANFYGKGHNFPTFQRSAAQDTRRTIGVPLSTEMAGWFFGFVMGKVVTAGVGPFTHTFTFQDPAVSKQPPVATIYEAPTEGILRRLHSMACNDLTVSFANQQWVNLSSNWIGSGEVTTGAIAAPPTQLTQNLMVGGEVDVLIGPQGAPVSIKERIVDGSFSVNQNLAEQLGYYPGSGQYRGRIWFTAQRASVSLRVFIDETSDILDLFTGNTLRELVIRITIDANNEVEAKFPAVRITNLPNAVETEFYLYQVEITEDSIFKDAGGTPNEPLQVTVKNATAAYLT